MAKKMLFVFNPKAGKGRIKMHLLDIVDIFSSHDYEVIIRATNYCKFLDANFSVAHAKIFYGRFDDKQKKSSVKQRIK